ALFDLQRRQLVEVRLDAPEDDASLWPGVQGDLQDMVRAGAHWAALVDGDGLLLAQAGLAAPQEALPAPAEVSLHLGEGALSASYALAAPGLALGRHALLVRLARRLVRLRAPRS
ncbi:MAG TPA: hypothetical protein VK195_03540, partial [Burkholderiaceae bacterium]|nr:hypothetical protein [Burkholderiaceae bacterium]